MPPTLSLLPELFDNLPIGVVVLDSVGDVVIFNRTEERLARRSRERVLGRPFFRDVAPCMNVKQLAGDFFERIGREHIDTRIEFTFPFPFLDEPRDVIVRMQSFHVDNAHYGCLFIEDVSIQRALERMKETLTSCLVHDLKNPLSAVVMNLDYLAGLESVKADSGAIEVIEESSDSLVHLRDMMLNLLDITRLETNDLPLRRAETKLATLLASAATSQQGNARAKGVELVVEPTEGTFVLDADVLRRAIENLVDNAIRHAPSRSTVKLRAWVRSQESFIEVQDQGPGLPESARSAIFDKFVQVREANSGGALNRGLGLTFVRLAARAHGGDAEVECPPSGGSIFRLHIRAT